jgi:hypothetical protein
VFTARYALTPYIQQIRFFYKGLMSSPCMNDRNSDVFSDPAAVFKNFPFHMLVQRFVNMSQCLWRWDWNHSNLCGWTEMWIRGSPNTLGLLMPLCCERRWIWTPFCVYSIGDFVYNSRGGRYRKPCQCWLLIYASSSEVIRVMFVQFYPLLICLFFFCIVKFKWSSISATYLLCRAFQFIKLKSFLLNNLLKFV